MTYQYDFKQIQGYAKFAAREWNKFLEEGRKGLSAANPAMVLWLIKRGDDHEVEVEGLLTLIEQLKNDAQAAVNEAQLKAGLARADANGFEQVAKALQERLKNAKAEAVKEVKSWAKAVIDQQDELIRGLQLKIQTQSNMLEALERKAGGYVDEELHQKLVVAAFNLLKARQDDYWRHPGDEEAEKKVEKDLIAAHNELRRLVSEACGCGNDNPGYQHCGHEACPDCNSLL